METFRIPRLTSEDERNQLKHRTAQLIKLAGGPEFFAPVTGVEKGALSKYGGLAYPDHFIRADVIVELDRQIGAPMMVETLANMLGFRLVPIEPEERSKVGYEDLAAVSKEGGDVVTALASGLADGELDALERRNVRTQIAENIVALHRLDRKVGGA